MLNAERPIMLDDLMALCEALGLDPVQVMRDAETAAPPVTSASTPPFAPAPSEDRWWEQDDVAALDPGYSPRMEEDQPDPDPDDWGA